MKLRIWLIGWLGIMLGTACGSPRQALPNVTTGRDVTEGPLQRWIIPPPLQKGDTVMIVAPAGYVSKKYHYIERADSLLRAWGLVPVHGRHLFARHYTFAGTDAQRAADLQEALDRPDVKAVWAARGGYGSIRIVDSVSLEKFKQHPKWLIGFSDITVWLNRLFNEGYAGVHGIMPISLAHPNPRRQPAIVTLKNILFGRTLTFTVPSDSLNIPGRAEGVIVGGNLSTLVSLLGSKDQLDTRGKILFLEDVDEYPYSYDRMLHALARAGYFDHLAGLIIGDMSTKRNNDQFGETVDEMVLKLVRDKGYPVVFGFPAGHVVKNYAIPFGKKAVIRVKRRKVWIQY